MIKKFITFIFLFLLLIPVSAPGEFQRTKIAVLDFEFIGDKIDNGSIGSMISEWFITSIVKTGRFDVVERALMKKIIEEQKLSATGVIDENSASKIGKILGVQAIITGSVLNLKNKLEINSRLINVESGSIIAAESIQIENEGDIRSTVEQLTIKIINNFPLTGYIVKKMSNTVIIDIGFESGLSAGTEFTVFKEGEVIKHPKTGEVLNIAQVITGLIRIKNIEKNTADGEILSEEGGGIEYGHQIKSNVLHKAIAGTESKKKNRPSLKDEYPLAEKETLKNQDKSTKVEQENNKEKKQNVANENPRKVEKKSSSTQLHESSLVKKSSKISINSYDDQQISKVLEHKRSGEFSRWVNPVTGSSFNAKPSSVFSQANRSIPCRVVTISVSNPQGQSDNITSTYCRDRSGLWEIN